MASSSNMEINQPPAGTKRKLSCISSTPAEDDQEDLGRGKRTRYPTEKVKQTRHSTSITTDRQKHTSKKVTSLDASDASSKVTSKVKLENASPVTPAANDDAPCHPTETAAFRDDLKRTSNMSTMGGKNTLKSQSKIASDRKRQRDEDDKLELPPKKQKLSSATPTAKLESITSSEALASTLASRESPYYTRSSKDSTAKEKHLDGLAPPTRERRPHAVESPVLHLLWQLRRMPLPPTRENEKRWAFKGFRRLWIRMLTEPESSRFEPEWLVKLWWIYNTELFEVEWVMLRDGVGRNRAQRILNEERAEVVRGARRGIEDERT